jgi:type I restriction enzyme S subunit
LDELASLPTNWKWIKNNELMFYVTSGSRDWKKFYSDTKGTYFVRTGDIKTNKLDLDGAAFVDLPKNVEGKRSLIEKGDLLMTITGANVGKIAHVDFEISEAYVSQSVALLKYVLKSFSPYLHYYFQSSATGAKFIGAMVYGVGRPVLSLDNMRDAPVSVCSFEEQHQIVQEIESRLSVCDKVEENITESLEKSKSLRQSILKKAFEGTLLSEEEITACKAAPDYEPASVLLEKIKAEKKKK